MQVDFSPRIESFWYVGGMIPPENVKRYRRGIKWQKHTENDPVNRAMQSFTYPSITLRSDVPLNPIISYKEAENPDFQVPFFEYDPKTVGATNDYRRIANIPG